MKKIKIPFTLEEYIKGGYEVEIPCNTENGPIKARIICTNRTNNEYPIVILAKNHDGDEHAFYYTNNGECLKGKKGDLYLVKNEFEYGDIITTHGQVLNFIIPYRGTDNNGGVLTEVYCNRADLKINMHPYATRVCGYTKDYCLATEEEKKTFFDVLEKVGKIWNAETKHIESIKPKYNLQPFDKVLVRDEKCQYWDADIFSYRDSEEDDYSFHCLGGKKYDQCIPYNDETKYLLGTSYDAPEKYKN